VVVIIIAVIVIIGVAVICVVVICAQLGKSPEKASDRLLPKERVTLTWLTSAPLMFASDFLIPCLAAGWLTKVSASGTTILSLPETVNVAPGVVEVVVSRGVIVIVIMGVVVNIGVVVIIDLVVITGVVVIIGGVS
jgi:hypothetical protein